MKPELVLEEKASIEKMYNNCSTGSPDKLQIPPSLLPKEIFDHQKIAPVRKKTHRQRWNRWDFWKSLSITTAKSSSTKRNQHFERINHTAPSITKSKFRERSPEAKQARLLEDSINHNSKEQLDKTKPALWKDQSHGSFNYKVQVQRTLTRGKTGETFRGLNKSQQQRTARQNETSTLKGSIIRLLQLQSPSSENAHQRQNRRDF